MAMVTDMAMVMAMERQKTEFSDITTESSEYSRIAEKSGVHPGFPSPAQDYINPCIDLNKELTDHPAATFYGRVVTDAMLSEGVGRGDILVIDRSVEPGCGDLAVCFTDGEFSLKRLGEAGSEDRPLLLWGVVTYVIRNVHRK